MRIGTRDICERGMGEGCKIRSYDIKEIMINMNTGRKSD